MSRPATALFLAAFVVACSASVSAREEAKPAPASAETKPAAAPPVQAAKVVFDRDVVPLIDRLGCNVAKCHGSTAGKGSLKFSLFAAEPQNDYTALVKSAPGRRVNRVEPAKSLVLLKATATIDHGGGKKFDVGSAEYNTLSAWIAGGLDYEDENAPQLVAIEAAPKKQIVEKGKTQQLQVTATYSDGAAKDVTAAAVFASSGEEVATVDGAGKVTAAGFGQTAIVVSYLRRFDTVVIAVPQPLASAFPEVAPNNKIDELVLAKLEELGIPPSELCSDEVFLRRIYLDVIGTLPTADEARAFLADADPQKRAKLIDRLLAGDEFADFWALKWGDLFRIKSEYPSNLWPNAVQAYHVWVRDSIARNKPYDQFARELLTSSGSNFRVPPVNFYRAFLTKSPQNIGEVTALTFMGARLGCARCHGHPSQDWDLDDNLGMAAFFAQVRYKSTTEWKEEIVYVNPTQKLSHPYTKATVPPKFLGGEAPSVEAGKDARRIFADWLTAGDNPWFARNIVNRTWFWLLGRGIVHEPDDLRPTNPPSNPELLAYLEGELIAHKYDLKHIYRLILNSRTYQLSSKANEHNVADRAHFSHYYVKRLGAESLLDAIGQVTQRWDTYSSRIPEPFVRLPVGFRATHLADGSIGLPFLEMFGRPPRDTAFESDRDLQLSMRQTLHLLNSSDVQNKINGSPRLKQWITEISEDPKVIEECYLSTLSRQPTEEEARKVAAYFTGEGKSPPAEIQAAKKAAEDALAAVKAELATANAELAAAEQAAKDAAAAIAKAESEGEVDAAAKEAAQKAAAEKKTLADAAKARRDKLVADEKTATAKLAEANKKHGAALAALKPRRDQALQDLLWALLNTKEFLFNH